MMDLETLHSLNNQLVRKQRLKRRRIRAQIIRELKKHRDPSPQMIEDAVNGALRGMA